MGPRHLLIAVLWVGLACAGSGGPGTSAIDDEEATMELTSVFEHQEAIPSVYTCDGDDISPPLQVRGLPPETETLALIVEDPDAPAGTWDHWVAFDIPPTEEIPQDVGDLGTSGQNSWGDLGYGGPCPPSGTHRYLFTVYALDAELGLEEGATKQQVLEGLEGHVLAEDTLVGTYGG